LRTRSVETHSVVKVHGKTKLSFRHYETEIPSVYNNGCDVLFYKKLPKVYTFSETTEESSNADEDIILLLSNPTEVN